MPADNNTILILYGSQTGSGESLARMLGMSAAVHGYSANIATLDEGIGKLQKHTQKLPTVFITSTYGIGEFPSNGLKFCAALHGGELDQALAEIPALFVFGLGNSNNENFCSAARAIENRAKKVTDGVAKNLIIPCKYSSETAPGGHEPAFRQFKLDLWASLGVTGSSSVPVTYSVAATTAGASTSSLPPSYTLCKVTKSTLLTPDGYEPVHKEISFHVPASTQKAALSTQGMATFKDQIHLFPKNNTANVERALARLKLKGSDLVQITPLAGAVPSPIDGATMAIGQVFETVLDLQGLPSRSTLEAFAMMASDTNERLQLEEMANNLSAAGPYDVLASHFWTLLDVLDNFSSVQPDLAQVLTHWPRIQQRTYSLSMDPTAEGQEELTMTFVVSAKADAQGQMKPGLATGYLSELREGDEVALTCADGTLDEIPLDKDVVFLALGTGIAPIRAVLQRRARKLARKETDKVGRAIIYYGYRHTGKNDLYMRELQQWKDKGLLEDVFGVASNDTDVFRTPLDVMDAKIKEFLSNDGHFLYCGIGGAIPYLVENAVRKAGVDAGVMRLQKRYHEEFFTPDTDIENLFKDRVSVGGSTLASRYANADMFCFQCEQTFSGKGCSKVGVCGKTPRVAKLQDLTVHAVKVMSFYLYRLRGMGEPEQPQKNHLTLTALFATLTNVNNDEQRFVELCEALRKGTEEAKHMYEAKGGKDEMNGVMLPSGALPDVDALVEMGTIVGVLSQFTEPSEQSVAGVCEMIVYACKGISAYADHSLMNSMEDLEIYAYLHEAMQFLLLDDRRDLGKALGILIKAGHVNVTTMALLDKSNKTLGTPTPAAADVKPTPGKCILISGHDLILLNDLLPLCDKEGINVYTHGEMMPAHGYPHLKAHKSLVGHFGGAWMRQAVEFPHFPGPILMTTNCLTEPHESYKSKLFTAATVGWPGVTHLGDNMENINWAPLIASAKENKGFTEQDTAFTYADPLGCPRLPSLTVGFGHDAILGAAPTILDQVAKGNITRFFVIGGCDGFEGTRSYYTDLAKCLPKTAVILTVGCGKFRMNHLEKELGTIGDTGIPRLLDMGQCNDSFGAVQVALGLAGALKCEVKDLPLSIVLSWFEQKAIAVLLSLMALGIKPIRVGPSLPAFITPDVLGVLVKDFGIKVCGDPVQDAKDMCAAKTMIEESCAVESQTESSTKKQALTLEV